MGNANFSDEFKALLSLSKGGCGGSDYGARLSRSGGFRAARGQPALAIFVEEAVWKSGVGRCAGAWRSSPAVSMPGRRTR